MPAAPDATPDPETLRPQGEGVGRASTMVSHGLFVLLPTPMRRAAVQVLITSLLVASICWYFGADAAHSVLVGTVIALCFIGLRDPIRQDLSDTAWRGDRRLNSEGARRDIAELSWSLQGGRGSRVSDKTVLRVQRIARRRLMRLHLNLYDSADRHKIEQLLDSATYGILVRDELHQPTMPSLLHCLDMLDALDPTRPVVPSLEPPARRVDLRTMSPKENL